MSSEKELIVILAPIFIICLIVVVYATYRIIISENELRDRENKVMKYQQKYIDKVKNADRLVCQYRKRK